MRSLILFVVFIVFIFLIIKAQIYLSKNQNKFLGLIFPCISFIISILPVLGLVLFNNLQSNGNSVITSGNNPNVIIFSIYLFFLYNIPTIILITIYLSVRKKINKNRDIEIMNIKEL